MALAEMRDCWEVDTDGPYCKYNNRPTSSLHTLLYWHRYHDITRIASRGCLLFSLFVFVLTEIDGYCARAKDGYFAS